MNLYCFSSDTLTNIWAGIGAGLWAVQISDRKALRTRAINNMPLGSLGILYCKETESLTTPFIVESIPEDIEIKDIWPETWILPFKIHPFGNPRKQLSKKEIKILLPTIASSDKSWHHILHIQGNTAFSPSKISDDDWRVLVENLSS